MGTLGVRLGPMFAAIAELRAHAQELWVHHPGDNGTAPFMADVTKYDKCLYHICGSEPKAAAAAPVVKPVLARGPAAVKQEIAEAKKQVQTRAQHYLGRHY